MNRIKFIAIILIVCILPLITQAQTKERVVQVSNIRGEYIMADNSNITPEKAYEKALFDAKHQAVLKAGFGEFVSQWEILLTTAAGQKYNSLETTNMKGEIIEYTIIEKKSYHDEKGFIVFYYIIDASVKEVASPDPNFTAEVNGVRSTYFQNDKLIFTLTPYRDCYLKVFLFEDAQRGSLCYPNAYDKVKLLKANEEITIPQSVDFVIEKKTSEASEINYLVFVFTKDERPAFYDNQEKNLPEIESWIAKIPNDEKFVIYIPIEIKEN